MAALLVSAQAIFVVYDSNGVISASQEISKLEAANDELRSDITILESKLSQTFSVKQLEEQATQYADGQFVGIDTREIVTAPTLASL